VEGTDPVSHQPAALDPCGLQPAAAAGSAGGANPRRRWRAACGAERDRHPRTGWLARPDVGFRIHAHGFRHTFATVATQLGWNFDRLRSAMGHEDYMTLHRCVSLAMDRDLGRLEDWTVFIATPPPVGPHPALMARR
jgi:hypothetical protein